MKPARKPIEAAPRIAPPAVSVNIDLDPLVNVVRRHVMLTPQATRLVKGEFAQLFQNPAVSRSTRKASATKSEPEAVKVTKAPRRQQSMKPLLMLPSPCTKVTRRSKT